MFGKHARRLATLIAITVTVVATTGTAPSSARPDRPRTGDEIGFLTMPTIGAKGPILEGVWEEVLNLGVGHYPGTDLPGERGNTALFGHRTAGSAPFARVHELKPGDAITVDTRRGTFVYRVREQKIIQPYQTEVLEPTPMRPRAGRTGAYLTLVTCHPKGSDERRLVVIATLDT